MTIQVACTQQIFTMRVVPTRCTWMAAVLSMLMVASLADVTDLQSYYTYLRSVDGTIFSGSVLALDTAGKLHASSAVLGSARYTTNVPMTESTSFRINTLSEILVATAVVKLVSQGTLPFSLNEAIPSGYLPRGVSNFFNPNYPLVKISLQMLLQHTSSITEVDFASTAYLKTISEGTSVGTLTNFCNEYFTTSTTSGGNTTKSSIWTTLQPGLATTYAYSRANVALLSYILEVAVASNPSLVTSTNKTAAAYIHELIFAPLGMTGSFVLGPLGTMPRTTAPYDAPLYDNAAVQDVSAAGAADTSTGLLHPAYGADYMYYSSVSDMGKLIRSLFLPSAGSTTTLSSVGSELLSSTISISGVSGVTSGVSKQGLGIMFFNGATMCTAATSTSQIAECPLTATSTIYGSIGRGARSLVGVFCTTAASSTNPTCVTVQLSYFDIGSAGTKPFTYLLGMAAAAFQSAIGSSVVNVQANGANEAEPIYGFYVFLGVSGVFIFVLVSSYAAEHVIQPAPIVAAVPPHALPVPNQFSYPGGGGYPQHGGGDGGQKYYADDNIAPPMRGGDYYD